MENGENGVIAKSVCGRVWPQTDVLQSGNLAIWAVLSTAYLRPQFAGGRTHRRRMTGAGFRPEIIVYVLIGEVKLGMVDHLVLGTAVHDFSRSLASCLVTVEEKVNGLIPLQERNGLVEIGHRIKHDGIERKCRKPFEGEVGQEVHKALEYQHVLMAVVDGRNVFGGAASLETGGAELSSVAVVLETDSEIRVPVCPIVYLPAITPGDVGIKTPRLDVVDKRGTFERSDVEDLNAGFSGLNFRGGWRSLNVRKIGRFEIAYGMNKVGLIHKHDEVDNGTADTGSVVVP